MKRRVLMLALFLILGAIVNVAVAWGLAVTLHADATNPVKQGWRAEWAHRPCSEPFGPHTDWVVRRLTRFGSSLVVVGVIARPAPSESAFDDLLPPIPGIRDDIARFESTGSSGVGQPGKLYWDGRGWPRLSMSAHWTWYTAGWPNPPITSGIAIDHPKAVRDWPWGVHELRALPLRPLWPGFAINTVFYAFILWLLFAAPFALRRRRRIKRGLCLKCAYPIGTNNVCTECGAAVQRSS